MRFNDRGKILVFYMIYMMFFFFKQKAAYEIYQCDWSSDVCSSDLGRRLAAKKKYGFKLGAKIARHCLTNCFDGRIHAAHYTVLAGVWAICNLIHRQARVACLPNVEGPPRPRPLFSRKRVGRYNVAYLEQTG